MSRLFLRKLLGMPGRDTGMLPEAALLSILASAGFRLVGVSRTQRWIRSWIRSSSEVTTADPLAIIAAALRAQRRVKRYGGIEGSCLERSFALWAMLGRRGVMAQVRMGLRTREGVIEGHAWVEYEGRALNAADLEIQTYTVYPEGIAFDRWAVDRSRPAG